MIKDWATYRSQALEMAKDGQILVYGEFCPELEEIILDSLLLARAKGKKEATMLINSGGGSNLSYTSMKGAMALSGMKFTGIVVGRAASNGFMLLQTCHRRFGIPGSYVMYHWGRNGFSNSELAAIIQGETWPFEQLKESELETARFVAQRTGVSLEKLLEYALYERQFTMAAAKEQNFIDDILPELPNEFTLPSLE